MISAIIIEDELAIAKGLAKLIQKQPDFKVLSICSNGRDGILAIRKNRPALVFMDIEMPGMSGLEMLEALSAEDPQITEDTTFVILSGYSSFDYARTAVRLRVTEYLLKPISLEDLNRILDKVRKSQSSIRQRSMQASLTACLFGKEAVLPGAYTSLRGNLFTIVSIFRGPLRSHSLTEPFPGTELPQDGQDPSLPSGLGQTEGTPVLLPMGHFYPNETVYVIVEEKEKPDRSKVLDLIRALYDTYESGRVPVTCLYTSPLPEDTDLQSVLTDLHVDALATAIFSRSSIHQLKTLPDTEIRVSQKTRSLAGCITPSTDRKQLAPVLHSLVMHWDLSKATQLQLITDLRFLLYQVFSASSGPETFLPDAAELVAASSGYEDLEVRLRKAFTSILDDAGADPVLSPRDLAVSVKTWLDENYASDVVIGNFSEIFGYNEKYISSVFKAEFGVTPSKYLRSLRIETAKALMRHNPCTSLKDISEAVGYNDSFYFSKVFKSQEGISPSAYLQSLSP
ncbi:MAG: AraC family transcriptional regulator [Blautia sp.]|nr:AraC family transcriptional regulator [Blautia sp.]